MENIFIHMLNIQKNVKLAEYSTFKIGGEAKNFVEVKNEDEFLEAMDYAKKNNLKFFILGGGSNVLFDDKGFDGIVIRVSDQGGSVLPWQGTMLECWAGEKLSKLVDQAKDRGLSGLEWAIGIPGTVGGALRGNAGAFGGTMADVVAQVRAYDASRQKIVNYGPGECNFDYRSSTFKQDDGLIVISVKIILKNGDKDAILAKMEKMTKKRSEKQPKGWTGNAGSFFMNPVIEDCSLIKKFEEDTGRKTVGNRISAGWLIEEVGLKGKKIGNISTSDINANFLINNGGGTMEEVLIVSGIIKQKVRSKLRVNLKEEVEVVYF